MTVDHLKSLQPYAVLLWCGLVWAPLITGCGKNAPEEAAEECNTFEEWVHQPLTSEFLSRDIKPQPASHASADQGAKDQLKKDIEEVLQEELMFREAVRQKLFQKPHLRKQLRQLLSQELKQRLEHQESTKVPTNAELLHFYEQNQEMFSRPRTVRASLILLASRETAHEVLSKLHVEGVSLAVFQRLVARYSIDEKSRLTRGDLGFFSKNTTGVEADIKHIALGLKTNGEVSQPFTVGKRGWAIVIKTGEWPSMNTSFEQVKPLIRTKLLEQAKKRSLHQFVLDLKKRETLPSADEILQEIINK